MASPRRAQSATLAQLLASTEFFPSTEELDVPKPVKAPSQQPPPLPSTSPTRAVSVELAPTTVSRPLGSNASPQRPRPVSVYRAASPAPSASAASAAHSQGSAPVPATGSPRSVSPNRRDANGQGANGLPPPLSSIHQPRSGSPGPRSVSPNRLSGQMVPLNLPPPPTVPSSLPARSVSPSPGSGAIAPMTLPPPPTGAGVPAPNTGRPVSPRPVSPRPVSTYAAQPAGALAPQAPSLPIGSISSPPTVNLSPRKNSPRAVSVHGIASLLGPSPTPPAPAPAPAPVSAAPAEQARPVSPRHPVHAVSTYGVRPLSPGRTVEQPRPLSPSRSVSPSRAATAPPAAQPAADPPSPRSGGVQVMRAVSTYAAPGPPSRSGAPNAAAQEERTLSPRALRPLSSYVTRPASPARSPATSATVGAAAPSGDGQISPRKMIRSVSPNRLSTMNPAALGTAPAPATTVAPTSAEARTGSGAAMPRSVSPSRPGAKRFPAAPAPTLRGSTDSPVPPSNSAPAQATSSPKFVHEGPTSAERESADAEKRAAEARRVEESKTERQRQDEEARKEDRRRKVEEEMKSLEVAEEQARNKRRDEERRKKVEDEMRAMEEEAKRRAEAGRKQRIDAETKAMEEQAQMDEARKRKDWEKDEEARMKRMQDDARNQGRRPRSGVDEVAFASAQAAKAKAEEQQRQVAEEERKRKEKEREEKERKERDEKDKKSKSKDVFSPFALVDSAPPPAKPAATAVLSETEKKLKQNEDEMAALAALLASLPPKR